MKQKKNNAVSMSAPTSAAKDATAATPKAPKATKAAAKGKTDVVLIARPDLRRIVVKVVGTSPVIVHAWDEKAKAQMRDKQQGKAAQKKAPKNPKELIEGCKYRDVNGKDCLPALAFKSAIVSAARHVDGLPMTVLRGALFVGGQTSGPMGEDMLLLKFKNITEREDMVRVGMGTSDMRYRPQYNGWSVELPITYNAGVISAEQIINLVITAGFSVGVFEWRPEKNGQNGRFDVDTAGLKI